MNCYARARVIFVNFLTENLDSLRASIFLKFAKITLGSLYVHKFAIKSLT